MGKAVFVSYKYSDRLVRPIPGVTGITTVRNYVDKVSEVLEDGDHLYKGEDDGEDMSTLKDPTIASKLGDKIFYSSITIVLISKGMREYHTAEKEQWIPWEISYSLKEQSRAGGKSKTNAVLAVVLPDETGSYDYYIEQNPQCNSRTLKTNTLFQILSDNMFNVKNPDTRECNGKTIYNGYSSYIHSVEWGEFVKNPNKYIEIANSIREKLADYEITKKVK